jgi:hypothetical protein
MNLDIIPTGPNSSKALKGLSHLVLSRLKVAWLKIVESGEVPLMVNM